MHRKQKETHLRKWRLFRTVSVLARKSKMFHRTMVILAFMLGLALLYVLIALAMMQVRHSVETQYVNNGRSLARVYSLVFENTMLQSIGDLDMYVNSEVIQKGTDKDIVKYIMDHRIWRPQDFLYVFFADTEGTFYSDKGGTTQISDRDYFKDIILGAQESSVGSSVVARLSGRQVLHIARAVRGADGKLRGIIGGVVPISQVMSMFTTQSAGKESDAFTPFVADSSMTNLLQTDNDVMVMEGGIDSALSDGEVHMVQAHGVGPSGVHGKSRLFVRKVGKMNWYVGVTGRDEEFFTVCDTIDRIRRTVFAAASLGLLLYYVISMVLLARLKRLGEAEMETDPVTGLLTRQALEKKAQAEMDAAPEGPFVMIVADLNGFKFINKIYGEQAGNDALCEYAAMLRMICRSYGGMAARGYADHFYYFAHLRSTIERFVEKFSWISENLSAASKETTHTFSPRYGIAFASDRVGKYTTGTKKSVITLIGEASTARKIAKTSNESAYRIYNVEMEKRIVHEQAIERSMHKALANGEFFAVYQPKISLENDKIMGAEALVRWDSPEMGFLSPDDFIPVFERNGFIKELDFEVYEMAFRLLRRLLDEGHKVVPISLNMSRCHTDPEAFLSEFMRRFNKYNLPHNLIEIEILERTVANERPILQEVTDGFQHLGFSVAMDDFGSGESSLNMLGTISVDTLKFDQNFLRNNKDSEKLRTFITSLVQMAQKLQKKTVFEGVETESQRDFLRSIKCDSVQGYFYSKPLKEADFVAFLEAHS